MQLHSSHFTFLVKMAPDCSLNITGPAITTAQGLFVTYCITFTFLLLCLVPFWVQLVTGCDNLRKLHCFNVFTGIFVKIFCIWNIITGLYRVAHQCGYSPAPMPKLKRDKRKLNHKPVEALLLLFFQPGRLSLLQNWLAFSGLSVALPLGFVVEVDVDSPEDKACAKVFASVLGALSKSFPSLSAVFLA